MVERHFEGAIATAQCGEANHFDGLALTPAGIASARAALELTSVNAHAATPRVKPRVRFMKPRFIISSLRKGLYSGCGFYPVV